MRIALLIGAVLLAIVFATSMFKSSPTPPASNPPAARVPSTAPAWPSEATAATGPAASATQADADPGRTYHPLPASEARIATLGSTQTKGGYVIEVELSSWGASVLGIELANYPMDLKGKKPFPVQSPLVHLGADNRPVYSFPFAARSITMDGQRVELANQRWELDPSLPYRTTLKKPTTMPAADVLDQARYTLNIADGQGQMVAQIQRTYQIKPGSYEVVVDQQVVNKGERPLRIVWEQNAQSDVPLDDASNMGDNRSIVAGYFDLTYNPHRQYIYADKTFLGRVSVLDSFASGQPFWPSTSVTNKTELAWVAQTDRYFAAVVYRPVDSASKGPSNGLQVPALDQTYPQLGLQVIGSNAGKTDQRQLMFTLTSRSIDLAPGQAADLDLALFAGPRKSEVFAVPTLRALNLGLLIRYEMGCTWCTFQPLAKGLLWFLKMLYLGVRDWGVAIIVLVVVVRLILHPITRRSQIQMTKMSKQMGTLQPEIEKLKLKYKDDQQKLNTEMWGLYREKGVGFGGVMGCLPMFLQMPIWIALYAMLYYAIELRHQPAFYGIFQSLSGGRWEFLADLSAPDRFIRFTNVPLHLNFPLISALDLSSLNLLPLLMAVVFYFQQKISTPPAANEQQAQQQRIMKWMTLLFPVLMYSISSGLTLYILASTAAGILDSWIVRRHIKREEEAGTLFVKPTPKPPKPGGWREGIQKWAQKMREQGESRRKQLGGGGDERRRKRDR